MRVTRLGVKSNGKKAS